MPYKYRDLPPLSRHFFVLYLHNELRKPQNRMPMEKNNQQKHNAKSLYEMALDYDLPGFGGDVTDKVRKAQELFKSKVRKIDYTRA